MLENAWNWLELAGNIWKFLEVSINGQTLIVMA